MRFRSTTYLKLKAGLGQPTVRQQDNTIISRAAEELVMKQSEAQMNVHPLTGSEDRVMKYLDIQNVDWTKGLHSCNFLSKI